MKTSHPLTQPQISACTVWNCFQMKLLTHFSCPQTRCLSRRIDVECVCMSVHVLSAHQKGAAEAFVWVNYKNGFKQQNRKRSPWIASVGWTVCHSIKTNPRCCDKVCVCVGVCIYVSWMAIEPVCLCLPGESLWALLCCGVPQQFCQRADKEKCLCVL